MAAPQSWDWDACLSRGDAGVALLSRHLRQTHSVVEDVTANKLWQKRDVDLLVDGLMVEVKTDSHKPVNIFLELSTGDKPGWVYLSRADVLAIVFPKDQLAYWISLPQLQFWLSRHKGDYRPRIIKSHRAYANGTSHWDYVGIAVPIADLVAGGVEVQTIQLDEEEAHGGRTNRPGPQNKVRGRLAG